MPDPFPPKLTPDHVGRIVMMVFGYMADGGPFWCFVATRPSMQEEVKGRIAAKTLDLRTFEQDGFGEIIVSGEGALPPQDVIKQVSFIFQVPIRKLFADIDPNEAIRKDIEKLEKELGGS